MLPLQYSLALRRCDLSVCEVFLCIIIEYQTNGYGGRLLRDKVFWDSRYEFVRIGYILDDFDYGKSVFRDDGVAAGAWAADFKIRLKVSRSFIVHMGCTGRQTGSCN